MKNPYLILSMAIAVFGAAINFQDKSIAGALIATLFIAGGSFFIGRLTKK